MYFAGAASPRRGRQRQVDAARWIRLSALRKKNRTLEEKELWEYALRVLAARAYSTGDLRAKLRGRAALAGDVDLVVERLREYGYLDDRRFAEAFASARLENEGQGKARVLRDLRKKRIPAALAEEAVEAVFADTDELDLIDAFLKRKFRRIDLPAHLSVPKNLAAAYRRLRYAGFGSGNSIRVLKRYSGQAERLDGIEEGAE